MTDIDPRWTALGAYNAYRAVMMVREADPSLPPVFVTKRKSLYPWSVERGHFDVTTIDGIRGQRSVFPYGANGVLDEEPVAKDKALSLAAQGIKVNRWAKAPGFKDVLVPAATAKAMKALLG